MFNNRKFNNAQELKEYMVEATKRAIEEKQPFIEVDLTGEMFAFVEEYKQECSRLKTDAVIQALKQYFEGYDFKYQVKIIPFRKFLCRDVMSPHLRAKYHGYLDWQVQIVRSAWNDTNMATNSNQETIVGEGVRFVCKPKSISGHH